MKQASLFSDLHPAATEQRVAVLGISRRSRPLTAAQRRFNTLLKRIETLRAEFEQWQGFMDVHVRRITTEMAPRAARLRERQTALAQLLDRQYTHPALGRRNREPLRSLLLGLLTEMLAEEETAELIALYDRHAPTPRADEQRMGFELLRALAEELPIDLAAYEGEPTPEAFAAWFADAEEDSAPRRRRRAKTAAEGSARGVGELDSHTLRTVFRRLASKLHPDRESDAGEHQRKTALMQELNAAYASGDLLRVLELQQSVDARAAEALAELDDAQLKPYLGQLQRQAKGLREQIDALITPLAMAFPGRSPRSMTPAGLQREFERALAELDHTQRCVAQDLERFGDIHQLREALEEARREESGARRSGRRGRRR
ncbi:MAG: J domain-containing protein [Steroidobacteraceae bacterium]